MKRFVIARKVATFGIILAINFIILESACPVRNRVSNGAWANEQPRSLQAVEFLSGYGQAELSKKKDYRIIPLIVDLDFNIKPLTKKFGFNPPSLVQFQLEPFLSLVTTPDSNLEVGTSFLLKLGLLPENWKLQPYVKGGVGMIYISQHTLEQSTQFNFISQLGLGFHYFINKDQALTLEYRFRHLSNASIKQPNSGIDNHFYLFGIAHHF